MTAYRSSNDYQTDLRYDGTLAVTIAVGEGPADGSGSPIVAATGWTVSVSEGSSSAGGSTISVYGSAAATVEEGAAAGNGSVTSVYTSVVIASSEGVAVAGGSPSVVAIPMTVPLSDGGSVGGASAIVFAGDPNVLVIVSEGAAAAAGMIHTAVVPEVDVHDWPRRAGWRNPIRVSDPQMQKAFDSLTTWTSKLGAGATATITTNQTITDSVSTTVDWDETTQDTDGFWNSSNPSRMTIPEGYGGVYVVTSAARFDVGGTGDRRVKIVPSWSAGGVNHNRVASIAAASATTMTTVPGPSDRFYLRAGDYVEMEVEHRQGVDLELVAANDYTFLSMVRVGDFEYGNR